MTFSDGASTLVFALVAWILKEVYAIKASVVATAVKMDVLWKAHINGSEDDAESGS